MNTLHLYNTMSRQAEPLRPIRPNHVGLYVCGVTVYDYCHLGHARVMIVFDLLVRHLRGSGYTVNYVRNITDIDDKIIKRANELGISCDALTQKFTLAMQEDCETLGTILPDIEPKVTDHLPEIIQIIQSLIAKKHAYLAKNGDVYYDVSSFANYGKLSGKQPDALRVGARVAVDEAKDDALDFVLWKAAKPNEPAWSSPWGLGRPGWHIECSAMSTCHLGNHFDIHGGGLDLQFPHHENEIAQSEGAHGGTYSNLWIHNGFVEVDDEKMSKSLGNFRTIRDILAEWQPEVIRYLILSTHYRSPLAYTQTRLENAKTNLSRFYTAIRPYFSEINLNNFDKNIQNNLHKNIYINKFYENLNNDLNTPECVAVLFELVNKINTEKAQVIAQNYANTLYYLGQYLGLFTQSPDDFFQNKSTQHTTDVQHIEALIETRNAARKNKDWAKADEMRKALSDLGIVLEDSAQGTIWRRA